MHNELLRELQNWWETEDEPEEMKWISSSGYLSIVQLNRSMRTCNIAEHGTRNIDYGIYGLPLQRNHISDGIIERELVAKINISSKLSHCCVYFIFSRGYWPAACNLCYFLVVVVVDIWPGTSTICKWWSYTLATIIIVISQNYLFISNFYVVHLSNVFSFIKTEFTRTTDYWEYILFGQWTPIDYNFQLQKSFRFFERIYLRNVFPFIRVHLLPASLSLLNCTSENVAREREIEKKMFEHLQLFRPLWW